MNEVVIQAGEKKTLDYVDGNLHLKRHAKVKGKGEPPKLRVSGNIYCDGKNIFDCSVSAKSLEAEDDVTVRGDLEIEDGIEVEDGKLEVEGNLKAEHVMWTTRFT